jgi:FAD/FMN-containing dehydrogenase
VTTEILTSVDAIDPIAIAALQRRMQGALLTPDTAGYNSARQLANLRYDRRPALIARCQLSRDVSAAVAFAREHDLEIAVRSGGHSIPGHSAGDGGMMIDLSQMKAIKIDPVRGIARVQPGATNGELVLAAQKYGLATTTGTCATVGMGGSTLGGGIGWLMGRFGATVDNVLAFEIATAEGRLITASADEHPDLFWALRGGGGNFGVVTEITYRLHQLGPVLGGMVIFHQAAAPLALREEHFSIVNIGMWLEGTGLAETTWTANAKARMAAHAGSGLYVNFLGNDGDQAIRASYRSNYDRLAAIKAAYDPDNIFDRNQNIKPANYG